MVFPMVVSLVAIFITVIGSRSGTGLLVCSTVIRAPEGLFGAVIGEYGVQDLLKVLLHIVDCKESV